MNGPTPNFLGLSCKCSWALARDNTVFPELLPKPTHPPLILVVSSACERHHAAQDISIHANDKCSSLYIDGGTPGGGVGGIVGGIIGALIAVALIVVIVILVVWLWR